MNEQADFTGAGLGFPVRPENDGPVPLVSGGAKIDGSIKMILMTRPGERLLRPEFGCAIWDLMFEPIDANLLAQMEDATRQALLQWEPRIEINEIEVKESPKKWGYVEIGIDYTIRDTNERRNLVYPFYTIADERSG